MFEAAELGRKLEKHEYDALLPDLRTRLLQAQARLESAGFSVIVLLNGVGGMADAANRLNEWLDARYLVTEAWTRPSEEEAEHPEFWRYWRWLPPRGRMGLFLGNWYTRPIVERAEGRSRTSEYEHDLRRIVAFEKTLVDDGTLIVKLWFHLGKGQQRRRLKTLAKSRATRFKIGRHEWQRLERYAKFRRASEQAVRETGTAGSPWHIVEADDERYRDIEAARTLLGALEARLAAVRPEPVHEPEPPAPNPHTVLDTLDFTSRLDKATYEARMPALQ
ncbi:MAG TPA: hypothetical protein VGQ57_07550, partial [Polyangiaceae bacterium]|nr:hypothetical protein [Polyangiaceae bacterium]